MILSRDSVPDTDKGAAVAEERSLGDLGRELARLRRTVLKHGHAQELFQARVEDAMARLRSDLEGAGEARSAAETDSRDRERSPRTDRASLESVQLRVLIELGQAARNLRDLAAGAMPAADRDESSPRSVREGLDLLEIRVRNLQLSFGLESIAALGEPFDDRLHQAQGTCQRSDLPDGYVAEEVLPGYLLHGEVERPALVIVNRLRDGAEHEDSE